MSQFLIVRADDLVHVGIQWSGFGLDRGEVFPRPRLVAMSDSARVTLTFPPQILSERAIDSGVLVSPLPTHRAGTSRVQFAFPAGAAMEFDAAAILEALRRPRITIVSLGEHMGEEPTAIEMPWKLIVTAVTAQGDGNVVADHAAVPARSQSGVTGLWSTRLRASDGDARDAGLALIPLRSEPGDMIPPTPLAEAARNDIVKNVAEGRGLPRLRRLELSSIGGSLSATSKWPTLEWDHDVVLGRDQRIRILATGTLYPFGHHAQLLLLTERGFRTEGRPVLGESDPPPVTFAIAGLQTTALLVITEPVRRAVNDPALAREFPFDEVEILGRSFAVEVPPDADPLDPFLPQSNKQPFRFPLRCGGRAGDILFDSPLIFVHFFLPKMEHLIARLWEPHRRMPLPGARIDMLRSPVRDGQRHDVHEVYELSISGVPHDDTFRPSLSEFQAELPALRAVLGDAAARTSLKFTPEFLARGDSVDLALALAPGNPINVDFTKRSDRSGGLLAPKYVVDTISRSLGPIPKDARPGTGVSASTLYAGATLLGMPLADVIVDDATRLPPAIVPIEGSPPGAQMTWNLKLREKGPFRPETTSVANLVVDRSATTTDITCRISDFSFVLPPGDGQLLILSFGSLVFKQEPGKAPNIELHGVAFKFKGALQLVETLADELRPLLGGNTPKISATPSGIAASYTLGLPEVGAGVFLLRNIAVHFRVDVPFNSSPTVSVGFGSRDARFNVSVLVFGGGGYIEVELGSSGLGRLEASIEFGAMVSLNFVIASAEVHALGGISFLMRAGTIEPEAFIRIGGSVDLLGLVSVSVELRVSLTYVPPTPPPLPAGGNVLVGRATLVIEIEVVFISESVTLDSGTYELNGPRIRSGVPPAFDALAAEPVLASLVAYYEAFAS